MAKGEGKRGSVPSGGGRIGKIADAIKSIASLGEKIIDATNEEKYANGIQKLNQSVNNTYAQMCEIIKQDDTLTAQEKLDKLEEIAKRQEESRKMCENAIKENKENFSKYLFKIVAGLCTCGISFMPDIVKNLKASLTDANTAKMLDGVNSNND